MFSDDCRKSSQPPRVAWCWPATSRCRFTEVVPAHRHLNSVPDDPFRSCAPPSRSVFASWDSLAVAYRAHHGLHDRAGTAVVVQAMVFGYDPL